jgi:SAM-dependent methyltransferase
MLKSFLKWNVDASFRTTPHALWESRGFAIYEWVAKSLLGEPGVKRVLETGAGRTWYFGHEDKARRGFYLIGIDIDADELALNPSLDEAHVGDVCDNLFVPDNTVDLILCRAVVEHLHDTEAFLRNAQAALRPGGKAVFVFAGKWAPAMVLNRIIPAGLAVRLLNALVPGAREYQGFKAYYDKCTHSEFKRALERSGFEIEMAYGSYYQSSYYQFFLPLHFLSIVLDHLRQLIGLRDLASTILFVARKPEAADHRD